MNTEAMRRFAAVEIMGWPRKENNGQPFYEHDELSLDVTWESDWHPDTDERQAHMLLDKCNHWACDKILGKYQIYAHNAEGNSDHLSDRNESFCEAALVACCKAWGIGNDN